MACRFAAQFLELEAATGNAPLPRHESRFLLKFAVNTYFGDENVRVRKSLRSLNIGEPGTTFPPT
jgi:hypothetical protein